jgi:hypothetical protein
VNISLGAHVVYLRILLPSSGKESLGDLEKKELCNVTLLLWFLFTDEPDTNLWDSHIGTGDAFGWLQPHKRYAILRAQELYMYGSEAHILLHIWDYVFRDGYVILPFHVLSRDDINQINNYTKIMKLVYRGADSSSKHPMVDFI